MTTFETEVLIIGAGMSGLMAARTLSNGDKRVVVLDKGRSVGGRLATRRIGDGSADHGAQFFTARDPAFQAEVHRWIAEKLVFEWSRGWSDGSLVDTRDGHSRFAVRGGMNALTRDLAQGLNIRVNTEVNAIHRLAEGWTITTTTGDHLSARALILTPPVPQSLKLLDAGNVPLDPEQRAELEKIQYDPCLAAMLSIDGEASLPSPGAIQRHGAQITWIGDNKRKGLSPFTLLTVQCSPNYSRVMWDRPDEEIVNAMRIDLMPFIGEKTPIREAQIKRWRYSRPSYVHPERRMVAKGLPLVFAGDAFGGPRVEGAYLSGVAAATAISEILAEQ